jgi:hypothetical protein
VNDILACLGKILRYAHEMEILASVPKIRLLKLPPPKFDFLTFEELERLVEVVKDDSLQGADLGAGESEAGEKEKRSEAWRREPTGILACRSNPL